MNHYLQTLRCFNREVRLFFIANAILGFVFFGIYSLLRQQRNSAANRPGPGV